MSLLLVVLLAASAVVLVGAEWPRLSDRYGSKARERKERARRKSSLRVIHTEDGDFAASVERDLANLPTTEERNTKRR